MSKKSKKLSLLKIDYTLGPLEKGVMTIIWKEDRNTVREVLESLRNQRSIAYTTVMTVMDNLFKKGFLERFKVKKSYYYYPVAAEKELVSNSISILFSNLISEYGIVKISSSYFRSNFGAIIKLDSIFNFNKTIFVNRSSTIHGLFLTGLTTLFAFSTWDLIQNLQFFGTLDYLKYAVLEPEILLHHFFLLAIAFFESLPLINLLTTLISFTLIIVFVKKLSRQFELRTPAQQEFKDISQ